MANKIQFKRGNKANLPKLNIGEPALCTDTEEFYIGTTTQNLGILSSKHIVNDKTSGGSDKVISAEQFKQLYKNMGTRTPEDYGAKGDGVSDDSTPLLNAMIDCANNNFMLVLANKYLVKTSIVYNGEKPLMIMGTKPNYNSLLVDNVTKDNEQCNIFFDNGSTLEINKHGSVTFYGVGFSSNSKETGTGILLKAYHCKFINCIFSQMNKAISCIAGWTNWIGENQVLYCGFYKCGYGFYSTDGSDTEFIGNLISGSCDIGFYGLCAGYTISDNHFYNRDTNVFTYFNTKIVNNYFQEIIDKPTIKLNGTFGCIVNNNNFELSTTGNLATPKGLVGIELISGRGNITLVGNSVHGKNLVKIGNLSFIQLIYSTTKYDMPLTIGVNNLRNCTSLFNESYPVYNIKGSASYQNYPIAIGSGTLDASKVDIVNGVCFVYAKISGMINSSICKFSIQGIPITVNCVRTLKSSTVEKVFYPLSEGAWLTMSDYANLSSVEVYATFPVSHSTEVDYTL